MHQPAPLVIAGEPQQSDVGACAPRGRLLLGSLFSVKPHPPPASKLYKRESWPSLRTWNTLQAMTTESGSPAWMSLSRFCSMDTPCDVRCAECRAIMVSIMISAAI